MKNPPNTIPFDPEIALADHGRVITRDGQKITSIEKFKYGSYDFLIELKNGSRFKVTKKGEFWSSGGASSADIFLTRNKQLNNSVIKPTSIEELIELRGMYRQAGFDVRPLNKGYGQFYGIIDNKIWSSIERPDQFTVYDSLYDYINDQPRPKDVRIPFGTGEAVLSRNDVKINGKTYSANDILKLAETIKENLK